jgi:hypothetical protein
MTAIQQVMWKLRMDYIGHPYYVSGNAILHAIGQCLSSKTHAELSASHGIFVPGQFGRFPDDHSQSGARPYLGSSLPDVEAYDDLFLQRDVAHPWLLDSRAREALNTHDLRTHGGYPTLAHETIMGQEEDHSKQYQTTQWYIHAYLHAHVPDILPLSNDSLDNLRFGGKRNYGYGEVGLHHTQMVDLEKIDYSNIKRSKVYAIELITPFVLQSEYPDADDRSIPSWWAESGDELRLRQEKILEQREIFDLQTIDHGQIVTYTGNHPVKTAKKGLMRISSHSRYGFGEFRLIPLRQAIGDK